MFAVRGKYYVTRLPRKFFPFFLIVDAIRDIDVYFNARPPSALHSSKKPSALPSAIRDFDWMSPTPLPRGKLRFLGMTRNGGPFREREMPNGKKVPGRPTQTRFCCLFLQRATRRQFVVLSRRILPRRVWQPFGPNKTRRQMGKRG